MTDPKTPTMTNLAARAIGVIVALAGLVLIVLAIVDFFHHLNTDPGDSGPTKLWYFFVGVPLIGMGFAVFAFASRMTLARMGGEVIREAVDASGLRDDKPDA